MKTVTMRVDDSIYDMIKLDLTSSQFVENDKLTIAQFNRYMKENNEL